MDTRHWYKTTDEPFFGGRLPQRFGDPSINQRSTLWKVSSMRQTCCALKWSKFHCYLRLPEGKSPPQKATSHMKREAAKYRVVYTPFPIPAMWLYYFTSNVSPQSNTCAHTHKYHAKPRLSYLHVTWDLELLIPWRCHQNMIHLTHRISRALNPLQLQGENPQICDPWDWHIELPSSMFDSSGIMRNIETQFFTWR